MMQRIKLACALLLVALVALMTTACSASDKGDAQRGGGAASADPQSAALAWARCMRENGVDIPDPRPQDDGAGGDVGFAPGLGGPMPGGDEEAFTAAKKACAEYAEDMGGPGGDGFSEDDKQRMVDFARCMREQGIDMPDPDFDGSDGEMGVQIDPDDPNFAAAHKACQKFFGVAS